jgi:hypothetical protein
MEEVKWTSGFRLSTILIRSYFHIIFIISVNIKVAFSYLMILIAIYLAAYSF